MIKRVLLGAAAGAIATVPRSAAIWGLRAAGMYGRKAAPEAVTEGLTDKLIDVEQLPDRWMTLIKVAAHFGFGAGCGAAFGLATSIVRPPIAAGVLAGLAIWKASYDGWIPAMHLLPPERDETGRQTALIVAHVMYGAALGATFDRLMARGD